MTKTEAQKWLKAFKKAKFKCIVPDKVIEALGVIYEQKTGAKRS